MVKLQGKGAFQGVNMIVHVPDNGIIKGEDGKPVAYYLDAEVDQSLKKPDKVAENGAQTDPHLVATRSQDKQGHYWTSHRSWYSAKQAESIMKAAGNKVVDEPGVGKAYGVKADVFANVKKQLVINTSKEMGPSDNRFFGKTTLENQAKVTKAAQELQNSQYEAKHAEQAGKDAPDAGSNKAPKSVNANVDKPTPQAQDNVIPMGTVSAPETPESSDDGPAFS